MSLSEELVAEADLGGEVGRKLLGDVALKSHELEERLAELGMVVVTNEASARRAGGELGRPEGHIKELWA